MASVRSQKVREENFCLLQKIAALKKVTQLLQKGYHKCALLFSWGRDRGRGEFLLCISLVGELGGRKSKMADHVFSHSHFKHFGSASSNISARRQTFQLDFVKHLGAASKRWELINLTMTPTKTTTSPKTITLPKTTMHIYEHFLCFCISQKLPVTKF
jgi:hypothetical protein